MVKKNSKKKTFIVINIHEIKIKVKHLKTKKSNKKCLMEKTFYRKEKFIEIKFIVETCKKNNLEIN